MINYDNFLITDQNFFIVLPDDRYHFNTCKELRKYCRLNNCKINNLDIRLGYDSLLKLNTFCFYDTQNKITSKLISEVEKDLHNKEIAKIFD